MNNMSKKSKDMMTRKIVSIVLALVLCLTTSLTTVFAGTSARTTNTRLGLNGRSGPGTNYRVLISIPPQSTVNATGSTQNGFTQITYNGTTCWVSSSYISYTSSSSGSTAYTTNTSLGLNMRASASSSAKVIKSIPPKSQITVYGSSTNGFYKASYNGTTGYVSASYVSFSKPSDTQTSTSYSQSTVKITTSGQIVDTFNGVNAIYIPGTGNSDTSTTYSCAALVSRYYSQNYGITVSNMFRDRTPYASKGSFTRTYSPKAGDVVYHTNSSGGGHWMILKSVNSDGTYTVFEQNYKWKSGGSTYTYKNRRISSSNVSNLKFFRYNK